MHLLERARAHARKRDEEMKMGKETEEDKGGSVHIRCKVAVTHCRTLYSTHCDTHCSNTATHSATHTASALQHTLQRASDVRWHVHAVGHSTAYTETNAAAHTASTLQHTLQRTLHQHCNTLCNAHCIHTATHSATRAR